MTIPIDLRFCTDEQINEECQKRIDRGDRSPDVYCSRQQSDDRAKLAFVRGLIVAARIANPHNEALGKLGVAMDMVDAIAGNPLNELQISAVNTTFYGKDDVYQDHSPKGSTT